MPNRILRDWTDSFAVNELDAHSERFFNRLIMKVDDYGLFYADTRLLKSYLFPLLPDIRETDITRWLAACEKAGLVRCYVDAKGRKYLQIMNFKQRLRRKVAKFPIPSGIGETDDSSTSDDIMTDDWQTYDGQVSDECSHEEETKPNPKMKPKEKDNSSEQAEEVFSYWQTRLNHPTAKLTAERKRKVQARLREGYSVEQIKQAIDGCASSPFHLGQNDNGQVYDDLELICRNGSKIEQFIQYAAAPPVKHLSKSAQIQKNNLALLDEYRREAEQEVVNG